MKTSLSSNFYPNSKMLMIWRKIAENFQFVALSRLVSFFYVNKPALRIAQTQLITLVGVLFLQIADAADQTAQQLTITNSTAGVFEVVSHRMKPTGAGAAIGGLLGAIVENGIESSQDEAMKKKVLVSFPDASCNRTVLDAFRTRLQATGSFVIEDVTSKGGATVDIAIEECGLHLADSVASQFASYVYLTVKFKAATAAAWNEKIQVSGRNRYDFDEFLNQPGLVQTELEDVLKRAGIRAADKIIYKK